MSDALTGWGAYVKVHNGTTLVELDEVVSFPLPEDDADEVEVTHLKSAQRRREYIQGLIDGGSVPIEMNYVPNSATDQLIRAWRAAANVRTIVFGLPDGDDGFWEVTTSGFAKGYARGPVTADGKMSGTLTVRISGAQTEAEAA